MNLTAEKLYQLLPAIYRIRDVEQGEPLKALITVIAEQAGVMEVNISRLYENWFIETCDEWVVPYIGDLLGVQGLHPLSTEAGISLKAFVANTLRYRRRKGTATVLEQLALDITGCRARTVEFFELLETTQYYNHVRPHNVRTPDLRLTNELELLDTAFDKVAHTVDVRHIDTNRGRHNIPNIGIFLWRLQSYFLHAASAHPVTDPPDGRYTFNPLGYDLPLFNRPQTETDITHLAEEINVPGLLRRRALYDELEERRQALIDSRTPPASYFGKQPVLQVFTQDNGFETLFEIPPENILICDLSKPETPVPEGWLRPPTDKEYQPSDGGPKNSHPISVAVDSKRGRIAFPKRIIPKQVKVSYAYGFSGDVGGGPYDRRDSVNMVLTRDVDWQVGVSKEVATKPNEIFDTVTDAIDKWNMQPPGSVGVIAMLDNCIYDETFPIINIPESSQLLIVAAKWPEVEVPGGAPGVKHRVPGYLDPNELRPHVLGNVKLKGLAPADSLTPGDVVLDGLLVEGSISVLSGNLGSLRIAHCTLVPKEGGLQVGQGNEQLKTELIRDITGPIKLNGKFPKLSIQESIVDNACGLAKIISVGKLPFGWRKLIDAGTWPIELLKAVKAWKLPPELKKGFKTQKIPLEWKKAIEAGKLPSEWEKTFKTKEIPIEIKKAIDAEETSIEVRKSTIFGITKALRIEASNCIFNDRIDIMRRQEGCIRFSYVPEDSNHPRCFRCQPYLALMTLAELLGKESPADLSKKQRDQVYARIQPAFSSLRYGDPTYAQLRHTCPLEIRTGADDGAEMGAFNYLKQPQREANLRTAFDEYLRVGLEAGIIYVT